MTANINVICNINIANNIAILMSLILMSLTDLQTCLFAQIRFKFHCLLSKLTQFVIQRKR